MTDEEINVTLARSFGYEVVASCAQHVPALQPNLYFTRRTANAYRRRYPHAPKLNIIPSYTTSLNACHDAEFRLSCLDTRTPGLVRRYLECLSNTLWGCAHASARSKAKAMLKAAGLYIYPYPEDQQNAQ